MTTPLPPPGFPMNTTSPLFDPHHFWSFLIIPDSSLPVTRTTRRFGLRRDVIAHAMKSLVPWVYISADSKLLRSFRHLLSYRSKTYRAVAELTLPA
jgi:hypothetical protein